MNFVVFNVAILMVVAIILPVHSFINQNCDHKCVLAGNTYCGPIPCPYIPCDQPRETTPGDCCEHCPTDKNETNRAAAIFCPQPCTQGGHHYCHPIPCPLPPCDNPVTTPGECCPQCPDNAVGKKRSASCPYPCTQGGHHYCHPVPCPHPPCDNPVTTPGECCPHCPEHEIGKKRSTSCPHPCTQGGHHYCHPVPCPVPSCPYPVLTPGECCPQCPDVVGKRSEVRQDCPFNCTINGHHFCHHIPCPLPPCADPITTKGDCCPHCPNGPTCTFKGVTIPLGQTVQVDSLSCQCKAGGVQGLVDCV